MPIGTTCSDSAPVETALTNSVATLRRKLKTCGMPKAEQARLATEIDGLSNETDRKVLEYFRCLADLPWRGGDVEPIDVERTQAFLDERHFGLAGAKNRILEYLAVCRRTREARGPILCLVGPPGVGKTSLAASVAKGLGRKLAGISCNGLTEPADVRGARREYAASQPGQIIRQLQRVAAKNPVFVLDEIDKVSSAVASTLLDALDPTQNDRFRDLYVGVPFDLSQVFFLATANVLEEIPTSLQNRLEVIEIAGYSEADKLEIAKQFLVPARVRACELTDDLIEFEEGALRAMIRDHATEMGVRDLDSSVSAICRRAALWLEVSSDRTPPKITVNERMVGEVLGTPPRPGEGLFSVERLRAIIERGAMPPEARRHAKYELKLMLSRTPRDSDYHDRLSYLRWLARLPWNAHGEERIDLLRTRELLDEQHWGLTEAKKRILEFLAVRKLGGGKGVILCLVGPPGVGKTSLARSIATAIGRKFAAFSCAGLSDGTEVRGHNRTWRGAQPGRLLREFVRTGAKNPVLLLDEIDKLSRVGNSGGDPEAALLEVLDPTQNHRFVDNYVEVAFDLSETFFVTTANERDKIAVPLQDRLEVIELPGYSEEEKFEIAGAHLVKRQLIENGLSAAQVHFTDGALHALIRGYTREAGVRDLGRRIAAVCRKVALRRAQGERLPVEITEQTVAEMLGAPLHADEDLSERMRRPGVAMGLSWTPGGGDVLFVEARRLRGNGSLTLSGQLGDVMKESAQTALSWLRANAVRYGIDPGFYETVDVHLHVPAGGVPKDGPSAGVAIVAALASELTERTVHRDRAMTGEITLSGDLLAVGGINEKLLAARRRGIAEVILPKRNARDVEHNLGGALPRGIHVRYVSTIDEALELALSSPARKR